MPREPQFTDSRISPNKKGIEIGREVYFVPIGGKGSLIATNPSAKTRKEIFTIEYKGNKYAVAHDGTILKGNPKNETVTSINLGQVPQKIRPQIEKEKNKLKTPIEQKINTYHYEGQTITHEPGGSITIRKGKETLVAAKIVQGNITLFSDLNKNILCIERDGKLRQASEQELKKFGPLFKRT